VRNSGVVNHAAAVLKEVRKYLKGIEGVGIDSPLFWVADGDRRADQTVRGAMKALGATAIDGTVQRVNSLRGACLVQGVMAARLIRDHNPNVRLTESHPKALLWLLQIASRRRQVAQVGMEQLREFLHSDITDVGEHQRDAALGAFAAAAMLQSRREWRDLFQEENDAFAPVSPIEYWMPIQRQG